VLKKFVRFESYFHMTLFSTDLDIHRSYEIHGLFHIGSNFRENETLSSNAFFLFCIYYDHATWKFLILKTHC
jgi:hypothetical protein